MKRKVYHCKYCGEDRPEKRSKTCGDKQCIDKLLEENRKTVQCEICDADFKVKNTVSIAKYCSDKCRNKRHERKCEYCREYFRTRKGKQKFCSQECSHKKHMETMVVLECSYCGEEFDRPVMGVSNLYMSNFCSKPCKNRYYTQLYYPHERKYGDDWHRVRKETLKYYDYTCQRCGWRVENKSDSIHVHHVIPRKYTKTPLNSIETLLPLCKKCHRITHNENDKWYAENFGGKI